MTARIVRAGDLEFRVVADADNDLWSMLEAGRWEPGTVSVIGAVAPETCLWVDIGAWIGPTVLLAAAAKMRVVAYEPHPVVYGRLAANVAANPRLAESITLNAVAMSTRDASATLSTDAPGDTMASLARGGRSSAERVPTVAARKALAKMNLDERSVIKMDIEGAEYAVVPTIARLLRRKRPLLLLSLHGYHLQERHHRLVARSISVVQRLRLLPALATYPHWYRLADRPSPQDSAAVRELGLRSKARLMLELSGSTLLFSHRPFDDQSISEGPCSTPCRTTSRTA